MEIIEVQDDQEAGIDIAPLIDILFTLIIFFLVTTTFQELEKDEKIQLPQHGGASLVSKDRPLFINVLKDGSYSVGGEPVKDIDYLRVKLISRFKEKPNQKVVLRGDAKAYHEYTTKALEAVSQAGFPSAAIAWDTKPSSNPPQ
jgi:biopolymer transport protein ExbD